MLVGLSGGICWEGINVCMHFETSAIDIKKKTACL